MRFLLAAATLTLLTHTQAAATLTCGDTIENGETVVLSGQSVQCDCGTTSPSYCIKINAGGTLAGTGTIVCPSGSNTCPEAGVKVEAGASMIAATIESLRIHGTDVILNAQDSGALPNFKNGIVITNGHEAHVENVLITDVGWYGFDIRKSSDVTITDARIRGTNSVWSISEGIHVSDSDVHLEDIVMHNIGAEALYVLAKTGTASVTGTNFLVKRFGQRDSNGGNSGLSGIKVESEASGSSATLTISNLLVQYGGNDSRCVRVVTDDADDPNAVATATIFNQNIDDQYIGENGTGVEGCTTWMQAIGSGAALNLFASVPEVCCPKIHEAGGGEVVLTLNGAQKPCLACSCG